MDDPWGSPWSTTDVPTATKPLDLEPPPRVRLSPNLVLSDNLSPQSPWTGDDAPGDWAGGDSAISPGASNPWSSWTAEPSPNLQPRTRRESPRKDSTAAWPTSNASSPSLKPLPHVHTPTPILSRQPSFDPWKSDVSLKITIDEPPHQEADKPVSAFPTDSTVNSPSDSLPKASSVYVSHDPARGSIDAHETPKTTRAPIATESKSAVVNDATSEIDLHTSRPSSRSSVDSKPQEFNGDSPVTSIEEEGCGQPPVRKVSSKVQELVEMYDGLVKKSDTAGLVPANPRGPLGGMLDDAEQGEPADEAAASGNFENVHTEDQNNKKVLSAPFRSISILGKEGASPEHEGVAQTSNEKRPPQASPTKPGASRSPPIVFEIPEKELKTLLCTGTDFDQQSSDGIIDPPEERPSHHRRNDSLDRNVYDNFEAVEERKGYFRGLRFGTVLRNNAVDYDNYISPPWSKVLLHHETIAKLRDWKAGEFMGISGFGSNLSRNSGFGWDSSAPTVSMDDIFGRKSATHARKSSTHVRKASKSSDKSGSGPRSPTSPNHANFGWSSIDTEAPVSLDSNKTVSILPPGPPGPLPMPPKPGSLQQPRSSLEQKSSEHAQPKATAGAVQRASIHADQPSANASSKPQHFNPSIDSKQVSGPWAPLAPTPLEAETKISLSSTDAIDTGFDNDDEWGEMVISPFVDNPAPFKYMPTAGSTLISLSPQLTDSSNNKGIVNTTMPVLDKTIWSEPSAFSFTSAGTSSTEASTSADKRAVDEVVRALPNLSWMLR